MSFTTPAARWQALVQRDPSASNAFVYSVLTTKIYCRPTCPSCLARRANIIFHSSPQEAEKAGFRPCLRCRREAQDLQNEVLEKACALIGKEIETGEKWETKQLAKEVGLTESHFCRVFKKGIGMTVGEYRGLVRGIEALQEPTSVGPEISSEEKHYSLDLGLDLGLDGHMSGFEARGLRNDGFSASNLDFLDLQLDSESWGVTPINSEQSHQNSSISSRDPQFQEDDGLQFLDFGTD